MILKTRVIPCLLIKSKGLYKGERFKNHSYVGDPLNAIKIFNEKEVDELIIQDITATIENREPDYEILEEIAGEAFMPMGYGGGISSYEQAKKIFTLGFEKVILNTGCKNENLVHSLVENFGSQSVVAAIDVKNDIFNRKSVYTKSGKFNLKKNPIEYAEYVENLGVGEIILTSIDREGSKEGYDTKLIEEISKRLKIPLVANGGAGCIEDFLLAKESGASAVAAGTMFVYQGRHKAVLISYPRYEDLINKLK